MTHHNLEKLENVMTICGHSKKQASSHFLLIHGLIG